MLRFPREDGVFTIDCQRNKDTFSIRYSVSLYNFLVGQICKEKNIESKCP